MDILVAYAEQNTICLHCSFGLLIASLHDFNWIVSTVGMFIHEILVVDKRNE